MSRPVRILGPTSARVALVVTLVLFAGCSTDDTTTDGGAPTLPPPVSTADSTIAPSSTSAATIPPTSGPPTTGPSSTAAAPSDGVETTPPNQGLPAGAVRAVDVHQDGTTWAMVERDSTSLAFARLGTDGWVVHEPPRPLFGGFDLAAGPGGTAWVIGSGFGGTNALWEFDGDRWITHSDCSPEGAEAGECRREVSEPFAGAVDPEGTLWAEGVVATDGPPTYGYLRREGNGWITYPADPAGATITATPGVDSEFAPDGHPHALTETGLFRLERDGWTRVGPAPEPSAAVVVALTVGADGTVWVVRADPAATTVEWQRLAAGAETWTTVPIGLDGLAATDLDRTCLRERDPGLDEDALETQLADPVDRAYLIFALLRTVHTDPGGDVWTAIECSGVQRTEADGTIGARYTTADGLPSLHVTDLDIGPDGTVWVATVDGLARLTP